MTEPLLNRSEAVEYIRKNADPACCLGNLDFHTLQHWQLDDYGPVPQLVEDAWHYSREELDDFIEIDRRMAKGVIKP